MYPNHFTRKHTYINDPSFHATLQQINNSSLTSRHAYIHDVLKIQCVTCVYWFVLIYIFPTEVPNYTKTQNYQDPKTPLSNREKAASIAARKPYSYSHLYYYRHVFAQVGARGLAISIWPTNTWNKPKEDPMKGSPPAYLYSILADHQVLCNLHTF